jgi:hypothetical protein
VTVIALASAKGSPGTTMTGLALASTWPGEVVLAEVDPAGGDLAWRCRDRSGDPLDPDRGLLSLGAAARRGAAETTLAEHLQDASFGGSVLLGVPSPEQLAGLGGAWSQLSQIFSAGPGDVLVDVGRVTPGSPALPVLVRADAVVFVVRPDLEGTAHLRERLTSLRSALRLGEYDGPPVGVVVVTSYRDTAVVTELQQLLDAERLGVRVLGIVADDDKAARILSSSRLGDPRKTLLGRSAKAVAEKIVQMVGDDRLSGVR